MGVAQITPSQPSRDSGRPVPASTGTLITASRNGDDVGPPRVVLLMLALALSILPAANACPASNSAVSPTTSARLSASITKPIVSRALDSGCRRPSCARRSVRMEEAPTLIDGRYMGTVLGSYWSDPLVVADNRVLVRAAPEDEGAVSIFIRGGNGADTMIQAALPVEFYGEIRDCDADVTGEVVCRGYDRPGATDFSR